MIFDVVVAGGGVVGLTSAALLNDAGYSVCVLEPRLERAPPEGEIGLRTYALTPAARRVLEAARAWAPLNHIHIGRFDSMEVWDAGSSGRLLFSPPPGHRGAMGYILEHQNLIAALAESLSSRPGVSMQTQAMHGFEPGTPLTVSLHDGSRLRTRLLIGADGAHSAVRAAAGIEQHKVMYGQSAILANVSFARPHGNIARQRFLASGPLAALPLATPRDCSIVWSCSDERAAELMACEDAHFIGALREALEDCLGGVTHLSPRAAFPLARAQAARMVDGHCVLLGDAAHLVHPLAGQGLNLGLMDVAALVECLGPAGSGAWPSNSALRRFERWRKSETLAMTAVTDGLNRLFVRDENLVRQARGFGMNLTQRLKPLKHWLISRAMGTAGDVPQMVKPRASGPSSAP